MIIKGRAERLAEDAAQIIHEQIASLLQKQQQVVIAVPGGRSVAKVFINLCKKAIPWHYVHVFLLDERLVSLDDPQSNYRLIREHLEDCLPAGVMHPFRFEPNNPSLGAAAYEKELQKCGGKFDIVLASSGEDGHIGSLFPGHHSVEQESRGFIVMDDAPKPPPQRVSASRELIWNAETGVILFLGESKADALKNMFNADLSYVECPAKIITHLSKCYILTDQEVSTP